MKQMYVLITMLLMGSFISAQTYDYPATRTVDVSDTYFGKELKDPYRWLEDIKSDEVIKWFHDQADFTNKVLSEIPGKQVLFDELTQLSKVKSANYWVSEKIGDTYFFTKLLPGEQTYKLFSRVGDMGQDVLLFDPENFEKGKIFDFSYDVNKTGTYLLLNLTEKGKELGDVYFFDFKTKKILAETLKNSSGSFSENNPNDVIYIKRGTGDIHDPEVNLDIKTMIHTIGTNIDNDKIIASRMTHPELRFNRPDVAYVITFSKSPFMILQRIDVDENVELYYAPVSSIHSKKIDWKPLCNKSDEIKTSFSSVSNNSNAKDNSFYAITTKGNDMGRFIKVNLQHPNFANPEVILEGKDDWKIEFLSEAKDYLIIALSKNGLQFKNMKYQLSTDKLSEAAIPLNGTVLLLPLGSFSNEGMVINTSWTEPINFYKYDLLTDEFTKSPFYVNSPYPGLENMIVEEVEVQSYDGTLVPLSIVYDKTKFKGDGSNITLLTGYGSYGVILAPVFSYNDIPLLERGVVIAYAHVRGGGEKGKLWHFAGQKTTKPNTWKDFNSCAEYLIDKQYTTPDHLACEGGSAGGILIGRAITERPDLYKVAIPLVGSLNPVRMEFTPNGPLNIPEFGTVTDSIESSALIEMDALHHIKAGVNYPAQLITTGFNDPRVSSWIPGKYAATMQRLNEGENPILLYVDFDAGHMGGTTLDEGFKEQSDIMAFILWQCGDPAFQVEKDYLRDSMKGVIDD